MRRLRAVVDIGSSVGIIPAGQVFFDPDEEHAEYLIRINHATDEAEKPRSKWDHRDWDGCVAVIIAGGESLTLEQCEHVGKWRAEGGRRRVIAINTSYQRAPFADIVYACDRRWWDVYVADVRAKFKPEQLWTQQEGGEPLVNSVRSIRGQGLSTVRGVIHQGANGAYQAIGLAVMWGAKTIVLLGVDCKGRHWHGDHPSPLNANMPFEMWISQYRRLAPDLEAAGVECINCSPDSALQAFPKRNLTEFLCLQFATSDRSPTTDAKPLSTGSDAPATPYRKRGRPAKGATSSSSGTGMD